MAVNVFKHTGVWPAGGVDPATASAPVISFGLWGEFRGQLPKAR